jgi:hypothetical protein
MASFRHAKDFLKPPEALDAACDMVKVYQPINDAHGADELRSFMRERVARYRGLAAQATDPLARQAYLGLADKLDALAAEISQAKAILMAIDMTEGKVASDRAAARSQ